MTEALFVFDSDLIEVQMEVTTQEEAFRILFEKMHGKGYVKETFFEAIIEREKQFPTGLVMQEGSIGIPHADSIHCIKPVTGMLFARQPFSMREMANPDNIIDVEGIFMFSITEPEAQVKYLKKLIEVLQIPGLLGKLKTITCRKSAYDILVQEFS